MRKHLEGFAAEQNGRYPASSVRGHLDRVATSILGDVDYRFIRVLVLDMHHIARHSSCRRNLFCCI